jgi:formylmethanofuran dehydrogenase subunit B
MPEIIKDVTCPFCGVVCDDIEVHVDNGDIVDVKRACVLGRATYLAWKDDMATPRIEGKPASIDACIERAADILAAADSPLIYGLASTSVEAQRKAIELADLLHASIDHTSSVCHSPSLQAVQTVGVSHSTLGEVKNRADLVIFWGANPAEAHPRHAIRYTIVPKGLFRPGGRKDRYVVQVDVRPTPSARMADETILIRPGSDYEVLSAMRMMLRGETPDATEIGGVPIATWRALLERMKAAKFGALYWGMGITMTRGKYMNAVALLELVRDLNAYTKFIASPMRGHGNVVGAATVLTWTTGYAFAVNMNRGFPRYNPGEFSSVDLLVRGDVDAALILAADAVGNFPKPAGARLRQIPTIALDPKESETTKIATVVIPTALSGVSAGGVAYRMDHVPLPLKKVVDSPYPADAEVLTRIIAAVRTRIGSTAAVPPTRRTSHG